MKNLSRENNRCSGFTLIELLISMTIFTSVVVVGLGSVVTLYNSSNRTRSVASIMNSASLSLESMTRIIRFGNNYHCGDLGSLSSPQDCTLSPEDFLAVSFDYDSDGVDEIIEFELNNNRIEITIDGGSATPVTPPEVIIEDLDFVVNNTTDTLGGNYGQPYAFITIKGYSMTGNLSSRSDFNLQTFVSQRQLDI